MTGRKVVNTITLGPPADPADPHMRPVAHPRHANVHEDHVGAEPRGQFDRLGAFGRLTHHLQVRLGRRPIICSPWRSSALVVGAHQIAASIVEFPAILDDQSASG